MNYCINLVCLEYLVHRLAVADIGLDEGNLLADDLLNAAYGFLLRVYQVINYDHLVASFVKFYGSVATYIACSAR